MRRTSPQTVVACDGHSFGGRAVPRPITQGTRRASEFVRFFNAKVADQKTRRIYAAAIVRLCEMVDCRRMELWDLSPMLLSFHLEKLGIHGMPVEDVRHEWRAIIVLFDWLFSSGIVSKHAAAAVPDPVLGLEWPEPVDGAPAHDGTIEVSAVEIARA